MIWVLVTGILGLVRSDSFQSQDCKLKTTMLGSYQYIARPTTEKIMIEYNMNIHGIVSVDLMSSKITFKVTVQQAW